MIASQGVPILIKLAAAGVSSVFLSQSGCGYLKAHDAANAEAAFRKALGGAPKSMVPQLKVNLATAICMAGRSAEAAKMFEEALPSLRGLVRAAAQNNYALCLGRLGNLPAAFQLWEASIASGHLPAAVHAHVCLGEEKLRLGDIAGALPHLAVAVASNRREVVACAKANLGHIQALSGNLAAASRLWSEAGGSGYVSASSQANVFAAIQLVKDGQAREAKDLLESVVHLGHPESASDARKQLAILGLGGEA